jgi:hypothetical protein
MAANVGRPVRFINVFIDVPVDRWMTGFGRKSRRLRCAACGLASSGLVW